MSNISISNYISEHILFRISLLSLDRLGALQLGELAEAELLHPLPAELVDTLVDGLIELVGLPEVVGLPLEADRRPCVVEGGWPPEACEFVSLELFGALSPVRAGRLSRRSVVSEEFVDRQIAELLVDVRPPFLGEKKELFLVQVNFYLESLEHFHTVFLLDVGLLQLLALLEDFVALLLRLCQLTLRLAVSVLQVLDA